MIAAVRNGMPLEMAAAEWGYTYIYVRQVCRQAGLDLPDRRRREVETGGTP